MNFFKASKKRKNWYIILFISVSKMELKNIYNDEPKKSFTVINMLVLTNTIVKITDNGI